QASQYTRLGKFTFVKLAQVFDRIEARRKLFVSYFLQADWRGALKLTNALNVNARKLAASGVYQDSLDADHLSFPYFPHRVRVAKFFNQPAGQNAPNNAGILLGSDLNSR